VTRAALTLVDAEGGGLRLETPMALVRQRRRLAVVDGLPPPPPAGRIARAAYALALAHAFEDRLARGLAGDLADLARQTGLSRARITQLCDLLLLAPDLQEEVLFRSEGPGVRPLTERGLRGVVRALDWAEQRLRYRALVARSWRYGPASEAATYPTLAEPHRRLETPLRGGGSLAGGSWSRGLLLVGLLAGGCYAFVKGAREGAALPHNQPDATPRR
jgi:hypothetical protein